MNSTSTLCVKTGNIKRGVIWGAGNAISCKMHNVKTTMVYLYISQTIVVAPVR